MIGCVSSLLTNGPIVSTSSNRVSIRYTFSILLPRILLAPPKSQGTNPSLSTMAGYYPPNRKYILDHCAGDQELTKIHRGAAVSSSRLSSPAVALSTTTSTSTLRPTTYESSTTPIRPAASWLRCSSSPTRSIRPAASSSTL